MLPFVEVHGIFLFIREAGIDYRLGREAG